MKKSMIFVAVIGVICFVSGCIAEKKVVQGKSHGNNADNVRAVEEISKSGAVEAVSVISDDDVVMAGIRLWDEAYGRQVCDDAVGILKRVFPDAEMYIVGLNEQWAENVIELSFYAEGGMEREILEKRFEFLVGEKLKNKHRKM